MKNVNSNNATLASNNIAQQIVDAIVSVTNTQKVSLHEPRFKGNEWTYLKECLDTTYVSSVGKFVERFEHDLSIYTGAKYAVAVVNGTAALHIALMLAGVQQGDEVLLPSLTFVATANAVSYCGATPHFVDSEEVTLGINSACLRDYLNHYSEQCNGKCVNKATGKIIRALVPMHTFGHPSDLEGLLAVAKDFNLVLIEDAAESLGSFYQGKHTGTFGLMGTISFNGNKTITTGGGGAILTNNSALAKYAKHLTTTAKIPHRWAFEHDEIGYNYRMPNINAALGCAQLEQLSDFLTSKRQLFLDYKAAFKNIPNLRLVSEPPNCKSNYWLQTILLDQSVMDQREKILEITNNLGLMTRPVWGLMHRLRQFTHCPRMSLNEAEKLECMLINIPSSAYLSVK